MPVQQKAFGLAAIQNLSTPVNSAEVLQTINNLKG
jgi:hypothetical protein